MQVHRVLQSSRGRPDQTLIDRSERTAEYPAVALMALDHHAAFAEGFMSAAQTARLPSPLCHYLVFRKGSAPDRAGLLSPAPTIFKYRYRAITKPSSRGWPDGKILNDERGMITLGVARIFGKAVTRRLKQTHSQRIALNYSAQV